jgi:hypothetical protein
MRLFFFSRTGSVDSNGSHVGLMVLECVLHLTSRRRPHLHTSAYVSIRQHMSAYVRFRQHVTSGLWSLNVHCIRRPYGP